MNKISFWIHKASIVSSLFILSMFILFIAGRSSILAASNLSNDTQLCLGCHRQLHPGIVRDWNKSKHAHISPQEALQKSKLQKRISAENIPNELAENVVGCAECHTLNPKQHQDTFNHAGKQVYTIVTPKDCATCHPIEREQYKQNKMSYAHTNLENNIVYQTLIKATNGLVHINPNKPYMQTKSPDTLDNADSCQACHGTSIKVQGIETRETSMGKMKLPNYSGWPNQGVGRINPDGSRGSCSSCHARHEFSISVARKSFTCSQCHKGPDVPAYKVYEVSKHGNIFSSKQNEWNFDSVPWTVGKDFTAPTCAVCHISLVTTEQGNIIVERTHQMNDRLDWRIFGIPYAHPQPKSADTTIFKNKANLPLPTELTGEPVEKYLIDEQTQQQRLDKLQKVCLSCHSTQWTKNHFQKLHHSINSTNAMTLEATKILNTAWQEGLAQGLDQNDSIANELIELQWIEQWLFYANSIRFASAMGGADYGVFAKGRWYQHKNLHKMLKELKSLRQETVN